METNRNPGGIPWIMLGSLAVLVALILLMAVLKPAKKPEAETRETAAMVTVLRVHPTNTEDIVYLPALVEANVNTVLSAEKAGRVVELMADRGDRIEKGQQLLQIDDRIWQANLRQANIAAKDAEKNHQRFAKLQKSGVVAQSEFDAVEKAYIQSESQAEEARINIEQCRVVSPITGTLDDRFVEEGEYVRPGTPVFRVVDTATVKVLLQVPEKDIYSVHAGDRMAFTVQPLSGRVFEGTVRFVAMQADNHNNAFRVELTVNNADGALRPGMIVQVAFRRGIRSNMVSLPMSAVLPSKGDHIVYLVKGDHAVRRKVGIETFTRDQALVFQGLEEGDRVVVDGNRTLSDGQLVEIANPEAAE